MLEPSVFFIVTFSAGISSCWIPICFIIPCIFFGFSPPSPGNILLFLLEREVI